MPPAPGLKGRRKEVGSGRKWCPGPESNQRHCDFQSHALPTELPGHFRPAGTCAAAKWASYRCRIRPCLAAIMSHPQLTYRPASLLPVAPRPHPARTRVTRPLPAVVGHVQRRTRDDERAPQPSRQIDVRAPLRTERPVRLNGRLPARRTPPAGRMGCIGFTHGLDRSAARYAPF